MSNGPRRLLPPTSALHCFAAAARHGSFSRAGEEVGLTQSAVSRQIAHLEDWLQTLLFVRHGRRVTLSAEGRDYAEAIMPALERIRRATARALERRPERELSIATLPSFGMRWLAPRLPRLTERHPDLIVNFLARSDEFDFADENFDAAIHFGLPDWPHVTHDLLFREEAIPVTAPALLAEHAIQTPADLAKLPLLVQSSRRNAWTQWFERAGVPVAVPAVGPSFEHFLMLAQAAAAGAGVALIPSFLIEPELRSGALACPFALPISSEHAYYLVYPPDRIANPLFLHFRDWIVHEAAGSDSSPLVRPGSPGNG
ncbi:transcriptional regulator GcvA [Sphingomonas cavernae]|uniref:Transcriptional regulator GcvA n=1 Tax=Sphingomonas cavernae TaxID=2320861 RepID=A0A418W6Y2_9SPHN|nr:transcriptional regulator GcvA [Sphingomonas cavernae]RJF85805.1 transcriptional regulator GcvA [Sphingomonas cavernae]